jgi:hypothetical protein
MKDKIQIFITYVTYKYVIARWQISKQRSVRLSMTYLHYFILQSLGITVDIHPCTFKQCKKISRTFKANNTKMKLYIMLDLQ